MDSNVCFEKLQCHRDARGLVVEPLDENSISTQRNRNVHVVLTEPGCARGNHYHLRGTETALVLGPALVRIREGGQERDIEVPAGEAWRFTIPPGIAHTFIKGSPISVSGQEEKSLSVSQPFFS